MVKKYQLKPVAAALGTTFAVALAASPIANAAQNPFSVTAFDSGYMVAGDAEGKCGGDKGAEGKCGGDKGAEGKCGGDKSEAEGKCGGDKSEAEGKCGGDKSEAEGKCGGDKSEAEGKCGGDKGAASEKSEKEGKAKANVAAINSQPVDA